MLEDGTRRPDMSTWQPGYQCNWIVSFTRETGSI